MRGLGPGWVQAGISLGSGWAGLWQGLGWALAGLVCAIRCVAMWI
jgi:uncharacterized membrane protein YccF (DUF307 family)